MNKTTGIVVAVFVCLTAGSMAAADVLFFEDFESGPGQWPTQGSMVLTPAYAYAGSHSQTFTRVWAMGDAKTFVFPVEPGQTYYLHVAYMTLGGGGFIGIDHYDASMSYVGEQWLLGDGGEGYGLGVFDYNVLEQDPEDLGVWKVYTLDYTIPSDVFFVRIKTEDYLGGLPNDPQNRGVFFDNIEWSTHSVPSYGPCQIALEIERCVLHFLDGESSRYRLLGLLALAETSDGLDVINEDVTVSVGTSMITIPAGSFQQDGFQYTYEGTVSGTTVSAQFEDLGDDYFAFAIRAESVNLTDTSNPVRLQLDVGNDCGEATERLQGWLADPLPIEIPR